MRPTTAAPGERCCRLAPPRGGAPPGAAGGGGGGPPGPATRTAPRGWVLFPERVHLIMPDTAVCGGEPPLAPAVTELWPADLARLSGHRWIAGCDRWPEPPRS